MKFRDRLQKREFKLYGNIQFTKYIASPRAEIDESRSFVCNEQVVND